MASLIGFAILALAAAVVVPDLLRASRASSRDRDLTGSALTPPGANDPNLLAIESQIAKLSVVVGSLAGRAAGGATGGAVSGAEVGLSRGLGSNPISFDEAQRNVDAAYTSGVAGGSAAGANVGGGIGAAIGAGVIALPGGAVTAAGMAGGAAANWAARPFQGLFAWADSIGLPNLNPGRRLGT